LYFGFNKWLYQASDGHVILVQCITESLNLIQLNLPVNLKQNVCELYTT